MKISFTGLHGLSLQENRANLRELFQTEEVLASASQAFNKIDLNSGNHDVFLKTQKGIERSKREEYPYIDVLIVSADGYGTVKGQRIYTPDSEEIGKSSSRYIAQSFRELSGGFSKKEDNDFNLRAESLFEAYA